MRKQVLTEIIVLMLLSFLPHTEAEEKRPNVILVMADDLGYEGLACNGGTSFKTPKLDQIAANGMRFTNFYSQPICTPSRVKLMTGRSNARNYTQFGHMDPNEFTIGHMMKAAGYKTCIAGKWQLCGGNEHTGSFPKESGFDESCMWAYEHDLSKEDYAQYTFMGKKPKKTSRFWNPAIIQNGKYRPTTPDDYGPDIYAQFIMDFIEENKDDPFFVYYPMTLTHNPFVATPLSEDQSVTAKTKSDNQYFGDMIRYTGVVIDRIITHLEKLDLAENTLIIFVGDNGSYRGIRSEVGDRVVIGGKALPLDAGVHTPFLAYWPGTIKAGSVSDELVDLSDFMPTLAALGNASMPTDRIFDGQSILPILKAEKLTPREAVLVHYDKSPDSDEPQYRRIRFAYDGRYKLYMDGRMHEVAKDWLEVSPIPKDTMTVEQSQIRSRLQDILNTLPAWEPDNSFFQGESDELMQSYHKRYGVEVTLSFED